jgi:hypothetical protein
MRQEKAVEKSIRPALPILVEPLQRAMHFDRHAHLLRSPAKRQSWQF